MPAAATVGKPDADTVSRTPESARALRNSSAAHSYVNAMTNDQDTCAQRNKLHWCH